MLINQSRSLSARLTRIVEDNAETLTQGAVKKLQASALTSSYHGLSYREVYDRVYAVYHHLGRWLWEESTPAIETWYNELGEERCEQGVPLGQVLWALVLTKDHLVSYLDAYSFADSALELYQQQEFDRIIGHFFDRAICYAAEGYERFAATHRRGRSPAVPTRAL
jgi:hypothetical protein